MFRDRTNLYISYRKTFPHHNTSFNVVNSYQDNNSDRTRFSEIGDEEEGLMLNEYHDGNGAENVKLNELPPSIVELKRTTESMISDIELKIDELGKLYKKNLLPGFNDKTEDESKMNELTFKITKNFQLVYNEIKFLNNVNSEFQFSKNSELKMIINFKKNLILKVQELSTLFRNLQNSYIRYLKDDEFEVPEGQNHYNSSGYQSLPTPSSVTYTGNASRNGNGYIEEDSNEDIEKYSREALKESSKQLNDRDNGLLIQETTTISDEFIKNREIEIFKIAQNVIEISTIFKELENLIIDQGTVLDRIDYNLNETLVNVKKSDKSLKKAEDYQKISSKCKLIFLLVLLILFAALLLFFKPKRVDHYYHDDKNSAGSGSETEVENGVDSTATGESSDHVADEAGTLDAINDIGLF